MRARTVVSGMSVVGALLGMAFWTRSPSSAALAARLPSPPSALTSSDTLELIVGDTATVGLYLHDTSEMAVLTGDTNRVVVADSGFVGAPASHTSSNDSVVTVTGSGHLRAVGPGEATITTASLEAPTLTIDHHVKVLTRRQASNMIVSEVCPNRMGNAFVAVAPISSAVLRIHEYHDCQRLVERGRYGPLVGIFADSNVVRYKTATDFSDGHLAAIIVNFPASNKTQRFDTLGIDPGTSCLILRYAGADRWQAAIIPQARRLRPNATARDFGDCRDDLTWADVPESAKGKLDVHVQRGYDPQGRRISPPVARWDWDTQHKYNYIGVKCEDTSWCEIGPHEFTPSEPRKSKRGGLPMFKGYYDEQFLATSEGVSVSTVFGTIEPGPDADTAIMKHKKFTHVFHVADLTFREDKRLASDAFKSYVKKYGADVDPRSPLVATSEIHLKPRWPLFTESGYLGRLNREPLGYKGIKYTRHRGMIPIPTVRWRWFEKDERTWSYCDPEGCCENVETLFQS